MKWAAWMSEHKRKAGDAAGAEYYAKRVGRADAARVRSEQAAKARDDAADCRRVGLVDIATRYDSAAVALDLPAGTAWPAGWDRAKAEVIALALWPGMPVSDAPDEFLLGVLLAELEKPAKPVELVRTDAVDVTDSDRAESRHRNQAFRDVENFEAIVELRARDIARNRVDGARRLAAADAKRAAKSRP